MYPFKIGDRVLCRLPESEKIIECVISKLIQTETNLYVRVLIKGSECWTEGSSILAILPEVQLEKYSWIDKTFWAGILIAVLISIYWLYTR